MKPIKVLKDLKVLKVLLNKWRSKILQLLTVQEYTIKQLSEVLKINPGTVSHHITALKEAELIEETRTEMKRNIVVRYYRAVAEEFRVDFNIITEEEDREIAQWAKSRIKGLIDALRAYSIDIPEKDYTKAERLITEFINLENTLKEKIATNNPKLLENVTPATKRDAFTLLTHYQLNQNPEYIALREKLLNFLKNYEVK